jgi:hypothetical protein
MWIALNDSRQQVNITPVLPTGFYGICELISLNIQVSLDTPQVQRLTFLNIDNPFDLGCGQVCPLIGPSVLTREPLDGDSAWN